MIPRPSGIVTLTTDFGLEDPYVGILKGALLRASDKPRMVDLSHGVPPQDLAAGAFVLWSAINRFPDGTVHVGIVDPGVGSDRRILAAAAHDQFWLAPDNALLGAVLAGDPAAEVREVDLEHLRIQREAVTFDGRDVFAPVAAMLASGRFGFSALGVRIDDAKADDLLFGSAVDCPGAGGKTKGRVVHVDHYGNLIVNVPAEHVAAAKSVQVGSECVPLLRTYTDAATGGLLAYVGSFGLLEVAVRNGSASAKLGIGRGATIELQNK
ncbi:MAG: S-adenosyl-l-methionine hydroxide adenosyltransferase family protein [Planctomycetota bacterium]